jgi:phage shock protein A
MSFFEKISTWFRGMMASFTGTLTENNPEQMLMGVIEKRKANLKVVKKQVGEILFQRNKLADEVADLEGKLQQKNTQLEGAVLAGNDQIALTLIQQRDELAARLEKAKQQHEMLKVKADKAFAQKQQYELSIKDLEGKLEDVRRQIAIGGLADATKSLEEYASSDADILKDIDEWMGREQAMESIDDEMAERDGTKMLEEFERNAEQMRQQQELAALKARLGGHQVDVEEVETVTSDSATEAAGPNKTI